MRCVKPSGWYWRGCRFSKNSNFFYVLVKPKIYVYNFLSFLFL